MNIALDAMGGDFAPTEIIAGAVKSAREFGVKISLVGLPDAIEAELAKHDVAGLDLPIVPATQVIEMDEKPALAVRSKPDSSMVVAAKMVKRGEAQAFVSAGNTGGVLTSSILHIGRIKGVLRPPLIGPFPALNGFCHILDLGANADVKPEHLQQFAVMGSIYSEYVFGVQNPVVKILSNGEEDGKGSQLVIDATEILAQTPSINFQGNIESQQVIEGEANVIVTDGFTGNVFIKTAEATARMFSKLIRQELSSGLFNQLGGLLARPGFGNVRERMDDSKLGAAVLLGLNGLAMVAHGNTKADSMVHVIRSTKQAIEQDVPAKIALSTQALGKK